MLRRTPLPRPVTAHERLDLPSLPLRLEVPEAPYLLCTGTSSCNSCAPIFCYFINCLTVLPPQHGVRHKCDPPGPYPPPRAVPVCPPSPCKAAAPALGHFNHVSSSFSSLPLLFEDEGQSCTHYSRPIPPSQRPPSCSHPGAEPPALGMANDSSSLSLPGSHCQFSPFNFDY